MLEGMLKGPEDWLRSTEDMHFRISSGFAGERNIEFATGFFKK